MDVGDQVTRVDASWELRRSQSLPLRKRPAISTNTNTDNYLTQLSRANLQQDKARAHTGIHTCRLGYGMTHGWGVNQNITHAIRQ